MQQDVISVEEALGVARDFDVRPDGSWIGVFERAGRLYLEHSHGNGFPLPQTIRYPSVRAIGYDRVVIVDSRPTPSIAGGLILSLDGEVTGTLAVGDGVQDVVVLDDLIAVTYFDEGVFSGVRPSEQGIAFFEFDGRFFGGYQSLFGSEAVEIVDCYSACRVGGNTLAFSAYTCFQLVRVHPRKRRQEVLDIPIELHGASAISVSGDVGCFFGPYHRKGVLLTWKPSEHSQEVGRHSGPLRGIDSMRFLASGEHGFTLVSWDRVR